MLIAPGMFCALLALNVLMYCLPSYIEPIVFASLRSLFSASAGIIVGCKRMGNTNKPSSRREMLVRWTYPLVDHNRWRLSIVVVYEGISPSLTRTKNKMLGVNPFSPGAMISALPPAIRRALFLYRFGIQ